MNSATRESPRTQVPLQAGHFFESFEAFEVVVPVRELIFSSEAGETPHALSHTWAQQSITIVAGRTNQGLTALGEAHRGLARKDIENHLRSLIGLDLTTWHPLNSDLSYFGEQGMRSLYPIRSNQSPAAAFATLDEALWLDALGQACGVPAYAFLGGKVRDQVAVDAWANRPNATQLLSLVSEAVASGFTGIKLKCSPGGDTIEALRLIIRDVPPDFRFTIDAMNALRSWRESSRLLASVEELSNRLILEDPFAFALADDWHQCRSRLPFTLACHARTAEALRNALDHSLADLVNLGGSAFEFQYLAQICEFHHLDSWQGSCLELGITQALRLHAAASVRSCVLPSDLQSAWVRESLLTNEPWRYSAGEVNVPDRPGLGVSLDHDAIHSYLISQWSVHPQP